MGFRAGLRSEDTGALRVGGRRLTFHSKPATASPLAAAVPASPTKCPEPMLLAKSDAPTCGEVGGHWGVPRWPPPAWPCPLRHPDAAPQAWLAPPPAATGPWPGMRPSVHPPWLLYPSLHPSYPPAASTPSIPCTPAPTLTGAQDMFLPARKYPPTLPRLVRHIDWGGGGGGLREPQDPQHLPPCPPTGRNPPLWGCFGASG